MGIIGLYALINSLKIAISLEDMRNKIVAIDGGALLYEIAYSLESFLSHLSEDKKNNEYARYYMKYLNILKCIFNILSVSVFDGDGFVPEKEETNLIRGNRRKNAEIKYNILKVEHDRFTKFKYKINIKGQGQENKTQENANVNLNKNDNENTNKDIKPSSRKYEISDEYRNDPTILSWLEPVMSDLILGRQDSYSKLLFKLRNESRRISQTTIKAVIQKCRESNFVCFQSEDESDFVMARLSRQGRVDYVMTEDGDLLTFGCRNIVRGFHKAFKQYIKMKTEDLKCENLSVVNLNIFYLSDVLDHLKFTTKEFVDTCILSKCDYVPNGVENIAIKKAFKAIQEYGTIENFLQSKGETKGKAKGKEKEKLKESSILIELRAKLLKKGKILKSFDKYDNKDDEDDNKKSKLIYKDNYHESIVAARKLFYEPRSYSTIFQLLLVKNFPSHHNQNNKKYTMKETETEREDDDDSIYNSNPLYIVANNFLLTKLIVQYEGYEY